MRFENLRRLTPIGRNWGFEEVFLKENIEVKAFGNVLTSVAFHHGIAAEKLHRKELDYSGYDSQILVTVRAVKQADNT